MHYGAARVAAYAVPGGSPPRCRANKLAILIPAIWLRAGRRPYHAARTPIGLVDAAVVRHMDRRAIVKAAVQR